MDDPDKIAVGDTVRVKHIPGPKMMVQKIITADDLRNREVEGFVKTVWFSHRNEIEYAVLDPRLLFKCPPRERSAEVTHIDPEHHDAAD